MPEIDQHPAKLRWRALSRWDNEGGAMAATRATHTDDPDMIDRVTPLQDVSKAGQ